MSELAGAPLCLEPVPVPRPWGGDRASTLLDLPAASGDERIGEWWLLSGREETPSRVLDGPARGERLPDLLRRDPVSLLGTALGGAECPLLIKVLDAETNLSVQVHPSERFQPDEAKTESWIVLDAREDAVVYVGLGPEGSLDSFFAAAESNSDVASLLGRYAATSGAVLHLPAGLIHALGGGIVALEIQQSSDTTYRIHDWDRQPARTLHLAEARRAALPDQSPVPAVPEVLQQAPFLREALVSCPAYELERLGSAPALELATDGSTFHALLSLDGAIAVQAQAGRVLAPRAHAVFVPAAAGSYQVSVPASATVLRARPRATRRWRDP